MLLKENRLIKKKDFKAVYRKGKFFNSELLSIKVLNNQLKKTRIGFVVGKKVSKKASVRNKIKRQIREIFRLILKENKLKPGFDIVVLARSKLIKGNFKELNQVIKGVLEKANLLK